MAKKIQNDKETATVLGYSSRPTLQIKDKTGKRRPLSLGFADALGRYGKGLREDDLVSAYRKAGTAFGGQLQPNFVVLHDRRKNGTGPWGTWGGKMGQGNQPTGANPKKRAREPEAAGPSSGIKKHAKQNFVLQNHLHLVRIFAFKNKSLSACLSVQEGNIACMHKQADCRPRGLLLLA